MFYLLSVSERIFGSINLIICGGLSHTLIEAPPLSAFADLFAACHLHSADATDVCIIIPNEGKRLRFYLCLSVCLSVCLFVCLSLDYCKSYERILMKLLKGWGVAQEQSTRL